jgi:curved DNA-binding protein CbpA
LRDLHPDSRVDDGSSPDTARLAEVLAAYDVLRDPHRRAFYDHGSQAGSPRPRSGVSIPVRYVDRGSPMPGGPVVLRAGAVRLEPRACPPARPGRRPGTRWPPDLLEVIEALLRRW